MAMPGLTLPVSRLMTLSDILDHLITAEGGFVDHPADRGGPTKFGITQATLAEWRGRSVSVDDVAFLTDAAAREIYTGRYVLGPRFHQIADQGVRLFTIDFGVHSGPARAARFLQMAANRMGAGLKVDGAVGPVTLGVVNSLNPDRRLRPQISLRMVYLGRLISRDHKQASFAHGWMRRLAEFVTL